MVESHVATRQQQQHQHLVGSDRLAVSIAPPPLSNGLSTGATSPPASGGGVLAPNGVSAPNTPLVGARGVPAMSPSSSAVKRGLRQKMMDELKSVRRKSPPLEKGTPALTPIFEPMTSQSAGMMPPPLMLNAPVMMTANLDESGHRLSQGEDGGRLSGGGQLSPADPSGAQPKAKGCSICERSFTVFRAKHTCKVCGSRTCDDCSKNRVKLNRRLERKKGSRLCDPCARKYVQASGPLMSPSASPMLAPRKDQLLQRRHSVPSHAFTRTSSDSLTSTSIAKQQQQNDGTPDASGEPAVQSSIGKSSSADSAVAVEKREPHDSHLRPRHWISLAVISALVLVRILIGGGPSLSSSRGLSPSHFITRGLDSVLTVKILGCYLLGLVVFDEIVRAKNKNSAVVAGAGVSSTHRRRRRTKSRVVLTVAPATSRRGDQDADDEVLEVDTGDKVEAAGGFSLEKLVSALEETAVKVRAANDELQLDAFLVCCESICGFVLVFGRATSFAGSTVGGYITSINTNLATWPAPAAENRTPWREQSIRAIVEREVELQTASVGGKKKPSCARCVLRLLWFIEFVEACVKYALIESADENCSAGASKAYEETIGSRHPWIIRKGVNSALGSIPSRSTILVDLHLANCSPEEAIARLKVGQNYMKAIVAEIHHVMKKHDLLDIK